MGYGPISDVTVNQLPMSQRFLGDPIDVSFVPRRIANALPGVTGFERADWVLGSQSNCVKKLGGSQPDTLIEACLESLV